MILKALAKSPDDRFQMVQEMVETLDLAVRAATAAAPAAAWVEGEVVPPAAAARKLHWPWDARTTALCVGITALALLVIGGMFFVLSRIQYRVQVVGGRVEVVPVSTEAVTPTPAVVLMETPTSEVALAATATPPPTTAPTVEYTPTPTPAPTWTPTPTRVPTPLAETIAQPATEMDSGSPKTLLFDSFDDSAYERGYNTRLWSCNNCEVGSISREDGAIRLELSGTDLALNLSSRSSWPSS